MEALVAPPAESIQQLCGNCVEVSGVFRVACQGRGVGDVMRKPRLTPGACTKAYHFENAGQSNHDS